MMPEYERQVLAQVSARLTEPHKMLVQNLLDAFRVEIIALENTIESKETVFDSKIKDALSKFEEDRQKLKSSKPEISDKVRVRLEELVLQQKETINAQADITEEVTKFQDSFEAIV